MTRTNQRGSIINPTRDIRSGAAAFSGLAGLCSLALLLGCGSGDAAPAETDSAAESGATAGAQSSAPDPGSPAAAAEASNGAAGSSDSNAASVAPATGTQTSPTDPSAAGPSATDPSAAGPSAAGPSAADPSAADPSAAGAAAGGAAPTDTPAAGAQSEPDPSDAPPDTAPSTGATAASDPGAGDPAGSVASSDDSTPGNDTAPNTAGQTSPAAVSVSAEGTPVERHGQLQVTGSQILGAHGQAVTLRGQGFGWDNWWPQYYNASVVDWLSDDWCVDIVRPAMGIEPDGAYLANPAASRARIAAVVEAAIAKGVYVIIDWHAHELHQEEAVAFFSDMAQSYGEYPNVIYEVYNEPEDETWPEVKAYAEAVGAAIRQHDPDNLIIVGNPEWDQRIDLVAADPITSISNVVYAVHFYAATHQGWLRDRVAAAMQEGIPVLISESSGSEAAGTGANDYTDWQAWFDFMDEHSISWINYSVSDKQGETISVLEPGASANGGWDAAQLTETGEYIRDIFRSYCQ